MRYHVYDAKGNHVGEYEDEEDALGSFPEFSCLEGESVVRFGVYWGKIVFK